MEIRCEACDSSGNGAQIKFGNFTWPRKRDNQSSISDYMVFHGDRPVRINRCCQRQGFYSKVECLERVIEKKRREDQIAEQERRLQRRRAWEAERLAQRAQQAIGRADNILNNRMIMRELFPDFENVLFEPPPLIRGRDSSERRKKIINKAMEILDEDKEGMKEQTYIQLANVMKELWDIV